MSNEAKDQEKAFLVFRETIKLLEEHPFDYAVGGGLATDHWTGGAEHISDIDIIVREEDAPRILEHLSRSGYQISEMEHSWLHKAFKDGVTLDLMFELKNGTRFDDLLQERLSRGEMFGSTPFVISAEDQVASLAGTISRETVGQHWYNVIDLLSNNDLDWDYIVKRSAQIPFKMLSIVYYALAESIPVEKGVIERLVEIAAADR